jgi:hypothetical protein
VFREFGARNCKGHAVMLYKKNVILFLCLFILFIRVMDMKVRCIIANAIAGCRICLTAWTEDGGGVDE